MAPIAMVTVRVAVTFLTRKTTKDPSRVVLAATLFPLLCLCWGGAVFVFQAIVNEVVFHRDPGIGDGWYCPLPNGYALMMIDTTDQGMVYDPRTQPVPGGFAPQQDAVAGVGVLQVAGRYIAGGTVDSAGHDRSTRQGDRMDSYFLLDTVLGRYGRFSSFDDLRAATRAVGIELKLDPIERVYFKHRFTWFDLLAAILLGGPPLLGLLLLGRRIALLRWAPQVVPALL
ncbi:MAG TPA: hypothetical protein VN874_10335 [Myxococcales bacterium]|nr:hypothetical protein [Myxococcales bacterium]